MNPNQENPDDLTPYWRFHRRMKDALRRPRELAVGLPRIADSTFRKRSQYDALIHYKRTIGEIMQYVDESQADTAMENAVTSLENVSRTLAVAATTTTTSRDLLSSAATSLNNAAMSLTNAANNNSIVFIYDLEEITLMSRNYVVKYLRKFPNLDSTVLYVQVENILDHAGFHDPRELHEGDFVNIEDAVLNGTKAMRRLAPKYDALRQLYNQIDTFGLPLSCDVSDLSAKNYINHAVEQIQHHTHQRWQRVRRCLELVNRKSAESHKNYANVVISGEGVATACAQLLASQQSPFIPIDNVFSTANLSKNEVFERIRQKFGGDCMLVYVTSPRDLSPEYYPSLRIWPVEAADSIDKLYEAQRDFLLR